MEKILDKIARERMLKWNLNSFKETHPHLFTTIIEAMSEVSKNLVKPDVSGRSELLVSFLKWYVKDEMMRKEKELITSIVQRYLNETNSH